MARQQLLYNKITNEERLELMEGAIDMNPDSAYLENGMAKFPIHKLHYCQPLIGDTLQAHLTKISELLKKHKSDYYIVFGPNRKRELLHPDDQNILSTISLSLASNRKYIVSIFDFLISNNSYIVISKNSQI